MQVLNLCERQLSYTSAPSPGEGRSTCRSEWYKILATFKCTATLSERSRAKILFPTFFPSSQLSVPTSLHPSPAEVTLSMSIKPLGYLLIPNKIQKTTLLPELTSLGPLGDQNYETGCI